MKKHKSVFAWALYDWANSVFATVVIAGFFPVVFKQYWASDIASDESTFWLGLANSSASLMVVILAPLLGAIADFTGMRKRMLLAFMILGVVATLLFYPLGELAWWLVLSTYIFATLGFMAANIFYDAMLIDVSRNYPIDKVSGMGFGFGYLGGGLLLLICVLISENALLLGFSTKMDAVLTAFILTGIWWFIFTMPLAFWVKESEPVNLEKQVTVSQVFAEVWATFRKITKNRQIALFLLAYWIYIDGVDTIIRMAVDYGLALGFEAGNLITALLITQFVGFPAAILYSYFGDKIGVKRALLVAVAVYFMITIMGYQMETSGDFYILAVMIGLVQGGVQALSRSFYARLIPESHAAEYFGVYNMMGKAAAVIGPVLMGSVALLTGNHRYSILSIALLFIIGFVVLLFVKSPAERTS
ncbi:MAG: MFS transporter [Gammaproteobacteria bacterium]|nr:MFS transporter [Gammaproteobacteria bacterium]